MEITANFFRDERIRSFCITHDWEADLHTANSSVESDDGVLHQFQVLGLSAVRLQYDCGNPNIEFCSVIRTPGRIYISFDPYSEGVELEEDNFSLVGREIVVLEQGQVAELNPG